MKIFKYPLEVTDMQEIRAPIGMKPLSVQVQKKTLCLWAAVDSSKSDVMHTVHIYGTGHDVDDHVKDHFVGTVQMMDGDLVLHVFCKPIG